MIGGSVVKREGTWKCSFFVLFCLGRVDGVVCEIEVRPSCGWVDELGAWVSGCRMESGSPMKWMKMMAYKMQDKRPCLYVL